MPWKEVSPVQQRENFINDLRLKMFSVTELCARYGVSRKTAYKWIQRYEEEGFPGLVDRSRAPKSCPHRIEPGVARLICDVRRRHPTWGAKKILQWIQPRYPELPLPAVSTAGDLLARRNLVKRKRRRRKHQHPGVVPAVTHHPNDLWTADFKGHFKTMDALYCYPLTVADQHTRFLLACKGMLSTEHDPVFKAFDRLFREYGLPAAIRTDNGVPFATVAIHGLSRLSVWWMRLGIQHQRILPGCPQQNGKHERMHKTLKAEATRPPKANLRQQQRAFDAFVTLYNDERPHDALDGKTPASLYKPSNRTYDGKLPPYNYPGHFILKRVNNAGTIKLGKKLLFLATPLKQNIVGLEEVDDGIWAIHFCNVLLAHVDERNCIVRP